MQTEVRHIRLDKATLKRVKAIAARREWSEAKVLRKAVEEYVKRER
jgi:predicted transcriptional regulator